MVAHVIGPLSDENRKEQTASFCQIVPSQIRKLNHHPPAHKPTFVFFTLGTPSLLSRQYMFQLYLRPSARSAEIGTGHDSQIQLKRLT